MFVEIGQLILAITLFGFFVVFPLTFLFFRHQRLMMEVLHGKVGGDALQRLEVLEREVRELKAERDARVLHEDDQRELRGRIS